MTNSRSKYIIFAVIVLIGVGLDQWTKRYASERLATTRAGDVNHPIHLRVEADDAGETLQEFLGEEFRWNKPSVIERIARYQTRGPSGQPMEPGETVEVGERITVLNRHVTVIEGFWDFEYTQNPGAAFGLLSEGESPYRLPFFVVVSLLALVVILYILRGVEARQKALIVALSMIGTGAVGNFIDRIRFGHVIDFIVWKVGSEYRWPTFNIADVCISLGVGLMLFEIFRDGMRERRVEAGGGPLAGEAGSGDEVSVEELEREAYEEGEQQTDQQGDGGGEDESNESHDDHRADDQVDEDGDQTDKERGIS